MESNSDHVIDLTGVNGQSHHSPIVLTFTDLCYSVKISNKSLLFSRSKSADGSVSDEVMTKKTSRTKTLLNSVSGEAREGEITAVLGASGSGKSTLIDALAGRVSRDSLTGSVKLNGEVLDDGRLLKFISAYVMQDDLLFPMLTVEETFMFSAEFRLPMSMSKSKKKGRVQALIDQLGLRNAAKTIIGDEGHRGVSGGERRRVSIGMDIIHDPIILFLDEPMSGLDSTSAFMVVKVLQRIARSGSIVMMSVHQPSSRILSLLDRLIFLSRGNTVFNGRPDDLRRYFLEFGRPIPDNENRTEFALDVIRELESSTPSAVHLLVDHNKSWQSNNKVSDASDCRSLTLNEAVKASISRGKLVSGSSIETTTTAATSDIDVKFNSLSNPFWYELGVLTRRAFKNTQRTPALFATRLAAVIITGIVLATVYWKLDTSPKGVQERLGFFAFAMSTTFYTCADTLPVFLQERYIFMRETAYNAYRRSSYVISNSIVAIPFLVILSAAFAATTFFAVGLYGGAEGFGFYFLIVLASFWAGSSFVTFISGVISNVMMGYTVVVAVLAYYLLLSGFFISKDRIPNYWIWFHYLSLVKYPYEAVLHSEFDDSSRCFARGIQIFDNSPVAGAPETVKIGLLGSISSVLGAGNVTVNTCITTGADILQQQGIGDLSKWNCLWITLAWGLFFRVLFYFALLLGSKNKRR